jgi:ribosomal protein L37AE/L43A
MQYTEKTEMGLADGDKKYFACPECGKHYRVRFDGGRYRCRQCRFMFQVPGPRTEPRTEKGAAISRMIKGLAVTLAVLFLVNAVEAVLLFRFYRRVQPLLRTANEAVQFMKEISEKFD